KAKRKLITQEAAAELEITETPLAAAVVGAEEARRCGRYPCASRRTVQPQDRRRGEKESSGDSLARSVSGISSDLCQGASEPARNRSEPGNGAEVDDGSDAVAAAPAKRGAGASV